MLDLYRIDLVGLYRCSIEEKKIHVNKKSLLFTFNKWQLQKLKVLTTQLLQQEEQEKTFLL